MKSVSRKPVKRKVQERMSGGGKEPSSSGRVPPGKAVPVKVSEGQRSLHVKMKSKGS